MIYWVKNIRWRRPPCNMRCLSISGQALVSLIACDRLLWASVALVSGFDSMHTGTWKLLTEFTLICAVAWDDAEVTEFRRPTNLITSQLADTAQQRYDSVRLTLLHALPLRITSWHSIWTMRIIIRCHVDQITSRPNFVMIIFRWSSELGLC